ncbi:MAG: NUDIX hydrolase [Anaerolineae bacterium]|nr:NUDIX hydrolase [Anaerolineae bacterium]
MTQNPESVGVAACSYTALSGIIWGMTDSSRRYALARFLKRFPWLISAAYPFYQLTRPRFTMGVVGIILDPTDRVLLAEHVYHPLVPWGVPGGAVGRGEDPATALAREFQEELAMTVEILDPLLVERTYFGHVDIAYLCRTTSVPVVSSPELLSARWFSRVELPPVTKFQFRALTRAYTRVNAETR